MDKLRPFQIAVLGIFAVIGVSSIALLSGFQGFTGGTVNPYGASVEIWGTLDEKIFLNTFQEIQGDDDDFAVVTYRQIDARTFEETITNAIAEERGPDMVLLPHEEFVSLRPKIAPIPYESLPQRDFRNQYVEGAEIFALTDGVYAIPLFVDPIIMYWNRDILASNGIALAPRSWTDLINSVVPSVTVRDASRTILRSAVAFGEYVNVLYAKEILSLLMMQSGSALVTEDDRGYYVQLNSGADDGVRRPLQSAVQFYVDFSNANSPLYTWNRAPEDDLTAFAAEDLALWFGYGSDIERVRERNPNLNFDVAVVPQGAEAEIRRTYGRFYGLALLRSSENLNGSFAAARSIASPSVVARLSAELALAPSHRATVAAGSENPFRQIILDETLIARGWLDPDPAATDGILQDMIDDIVSNRAKVGGAVADTISRIELVF